MQKIFSHLRKSRKKGGRNSLLPSQSPENLGRQRDCGNLADDSLIATLQFFEIHENDEKPMSVSADYPG
jgi:hypothetical protein